MAFRDLRDYLAALEARGELKRIPSLAWSSTDHDWSARAAWSHAVRWNDWGENFPTTDIYTIGVRYGFR